MSIISEDVRSALSHIPATNRDLWVRMAMALKAEFGDMALDVWLQWSQTDDSYRERDALAVWKSISSTVGITIKSLFREAIDRGWVPATNENTARAVFSVTPIRATRTEPLDWSTRAEQIWRRTQPLRGSLGEIYLQHRGCILPPRDSHLRYLPGNDKYPPTLCAAITDIRTAQPISLHFTALTADGKSRGARRLMAGHRKRGGCIRLWPDEAVTHGLALAEGIETALSVAHAYTPTWATVDAGGMAAFPVLTGIEALVLFVDGDDAGIDAAVECADRWTKAGKDVLVTFPSALGTDMNDEVRA